ncbi:unnamed protein product [Malassezia sympodialis ATCC 42132]|uniref:Similar to S.cerevisiae protein PRP6 (Splicing factor) n=1 Tax=Malassezia sympodialis (strain ATCC 42132) TaxID=1230383 RepID=M5E4Y5_MALS4|nr:uncharacterized protein MSY001_0152 [Malassezia sympodialis ATCC 42132]CCU97446.1 unnamed protein product [Malassezia sympodialis ATCC 42132]SHO77168.1 Similar to S.cerevisiae protein PRP6 (Splicing factor) [Malassezia sympodialis ATCC 42132]|eukprot:XP_018738797.1 uncharacterized protein MSY001_0152 [Malassezia sympodialis ATCC 42132]
MASSTPNKLAFLSMQAPAGYVAGLGRGATGFTTRSDIGPAREGPSSEVIAAARARRGEDDDDDNERFQDPEEETALFATSVYEKDDEEADKIWENVDRHMDERRRKQREAREAEEREALRQSQPKIQAQFADLKRNLSTVSEEEWASLPEPGNLTGKRRKAASLREGRDNRTYAMPDSVIMSARNQNEMQTTAADADGTVSSLTEIGEARNKVFSHQLDQASSQSAIAASGLSSTIDPKGYLTELSGVSVKSSAEIGDIKKARSLLDSVIRTNPKHAPGWIAAARLEEVAGKMAVARKVIAQGCEQCPRSEDVWLESARLNTVEHAKVILARAIQHLSQSVSIWLKAMELERDVESKKRVLRKALEHIPHSVKLWKELVNLEESPQDARVLLAGAVEAVPLSVELWLALARLSVPAEAKSVLNRARRTIPTSHEIWIAAARLLEEDKEEGTANRVDRTMAAAVASLSKAGAVLSRDQWLREAEQADKEGSPQTCAAIVKATIHLDLDAEDRRRVWAEDAQACVEHGRIATGRAILQCALDEFPDALEIWRQAATLERVHGTSASLQALLERGVQHCPHAESLWLLYADDLQRIDDVDGARTVLSRAFDANIGSETISLAAAKLEADVGELDRAGALLARARTDVPTERVWATSIELYWRQKLWDEALRLCLQALQLFPKSAALHIMHGRLYEAQAQVSQAREAYATGRQACANHTQLWVLASRLEESVQASIRARALLEKGRQALGTSDVLWAESAAVELRTGNTVQAKTLLSRGLQACPTSGLLMSASIWLEPRPSRKTRAAEALRRSGDSPYVICTVARLFWDDGKHVQARDWFAKTVQAARMWGDGWAWWYAFEETQADGEAQRPQLLEKIDKVQPKEGDVWETLRAMPEHASKPASTLLPLAAREVMARTTAT